MNLKSFLLEGEPDQWAVLYTPYWGTHVLPIKDDSDHTVDSTCECHPRVDLEDGLVIIHNSFDGREVLEEANRIINGNADCPCGSGDRFDMCCSPQKLPC